MPLITVTVKTLNGDLLQIQHDSLLGFNRFVDEVYNALPDVPIGCLVLHRLLVDERTLYNCVLDELLDIDKVRTPYHISHVRDGDHVFATVDPSRVMVRLNIHKNVYTTRDGINVRLHPFTINLYSKVIYDEKRKGHAHLGKMFSLTKRIIFLRYDILLPLLVISISIWQMIWDNYILTIKQVKQGGYH